MLEQTTASAGERAREFPRNPGRPPRPRRCAASAAWVALALLMATPGFAQAHVRWFSQAVDDSASPRPLLALIGSPIFVSLLLMAVVAVACVRGLDAWLATGSSRLLHVQRRIDSRMSLLAAPVVRVGCAVFFAAIALYFEAEPITLTPELKSPTPWVVPLQLAVAGGLLLPAGVLPACAGLVLLYVYSAWIHGPVHVFDYHFFLGVCAFLCLDRLSPRRGEASGLLVLRALVATSFLWVGIEKWLYPAWTCDILEHQLPMLAMGFDPEFWAMAAGFVEVTLAFLMLFGGVSSQVAAATLLLLLTAAIPVVGVVDAIGHIPMVAALFVLATTRNRLPRFLQEQGTWQPAGFCKVFLLAVTGMTGFYFLAHAFTPLADPRSPEVWADAALAAIAGSALSVWMLRRVLRHRFCGGSSDRAEVLHGFGVQPLGTLAQGRDELALGGYFVQGHLAIGQQVTQVDELRFFENELTVSIGPVAQERIGPRRGRRAVRVFFHDFRKGVIRLV